MGKGDKNGIMLKGVKIGEIIVCIQIKFEYAVKISLQYSVNLKNIELPQLLKTIYCLKNLILFGQPRRNTIAKRRTVKIHRIFMINLVNPIMSQSFRLTLR
jgi:hypothetical protein